MADHSSQSSTESTGNREKKKNLVLIRHAQSTENVKVIRFFEGLKRLRNFQLPTCEQMTGTLSLLSLTIDSEVSEQGKRQILDMHMILKDDKFWDRQKFDLIVCSPLIRARETCRGILPIPSDKNAMEFMIHNDLEEATPYEHVFASTLLTRIKIFTEWLESREEKNILIVGHSQYFKKLLGLKALMRNCDVWQCDFTSDVGVSRDLPTPTTTYQWLNINLLHRTELSNIHPYDEMMNMNGIGKAATADEKSGEDVYNDLHPDEPSCRICQVLYLLFLFNFTPVDCP